MLLEMRRYAIRNRARIRFTLPQAGECVVNEHGLLKLPPLQSVPDFKLDSSLGEVEQFILDPVQDTARPQKLSRKELLALLGDARKPEPGHEE